MQDSKQSFLKCMHFQHYVSINYWFSRLHQIPHHPMCTTMHLDIRFGLSQLQVTTIYVIL